MWESLKKILKTSNEKAVIIEDGELKYVVLSVDEYMRLSGREANSQNYQAREQIFDTPGQNHISPTTANQSNPYMQSTDLNSMPIDLSDIDVSEEMSPVELSSNSNLGIEDLTF